MLISPLWDKQGPSVLLTSAVLLRNAAHNTSRATGLGKFAQVYLETRQGTKMTLQKKKNIYISAIKGKYRQSSMLTADTVRSRELRSTDPRGHQLQLRHHRRVHQVPVHHQADLDGVRREGQDVGERADCRQTRQNKTGEMLGVFCFLFFFWTKRHFEVAHHMSSSQPRGAFGG